jgi:ribose 5-phosphate isomerase B
MRIAVASDHVALEMKFEAIIHLESLGHVTVDVGTYGPERCDYPVFAAKACAEVLEGRAGLAVLICGTGVGMGIAANKHRGIRCCVCSEPYSAKLSRQHNDSNAISFGSRVIGVETAKMILDAWLEAEFEGGRHAARVEMLRLIEAGEDLGKRD